MLAVPSSCSSPHVLTHAYANTHAQVFNLLVASSSRPDTPQCFLLTPKLISNLTYTDTVRVLSIEHINQGSVWMPYNYLGWLYDTAVGCGGRAAMYSDSDGEEGEEGEEGSEAEEGGAQAAGGRRGRGSKKGKQATGRGGGVAGGLEWRNKALGNLPWSCTKVRRLGARERKETV